MGSRLQWVGLLGVAFLMLLRLVGEQRPEDSLWDEIYRSAWTGMYTNDQATRGAAVFRERCASCHGAALEGTDDGPPLAGRDFTYDWDGCNIADLFEKIKYTMPANRPGRLSERQAADVLSYILKFNRFPAGLSELPSTADDLRGVRFVAENPGR